MVIWTASKVGCTLFIDAPHTLALRARDSSPQRLVFTRFESLLSGRTYKRLQRTSGAFRELLREYSGHRSEERSDKGDKEVFKGYLNGLQMGVKRWCIRGQKCLFFCVWSDDWSDKWSDKTRKIPPRIHPYMIPKVRESHPLMYFLCKLNRGIMYQNMRESPPICTFFCTKK